MIFKKYSTRQITLPSLCAPFSVLFRLCIRCVLQNRRRRRRRKCYFVCKVALRPFYLLFCSHVNPSFFLSFFLSVFPLSFLLLSFSFLFCFFLSFLIFFLSIYLSLSSFLRRPPPLPAPLFPPFLFCFCFDFVYLYFRCYNFEITFSWRWSDFQAVFAWPVYTRCSCLPNYIHRQDIPS